MCLCDFNQHSTFSKVNCKFHLTISQTTRTFMTESSTSYVVMVEGTLIIICTIEKKFKVQLGIVAIKSREVVYTLLVDI